MPPRRDFCLLCERKLEPWRDGSIQIHPAAEDCEVVFTDAWGVAIELDLDAWPEDHPLPEAVNIEDEEGIIKIDRFPHVDDLMQGFFDARGLPRLGGKSSGRGWTSFGLWQRCPYAWKRRHIDHARPAINVESPSIAVGSLVHAYLALYYLQLRPESEYAGILPKTLHDDLIGKANPEFLTLAWRVFVGYTLFYKHEEIVPLAIEHDLKDPRTGESCRYDMVAFHPSALNGRPAGTYIYEHKTTAQFSDDNLNGWANDGEILGEVMLWQTLGLDKRFGELKGLVVNILGKQKEPRFHRTLVAPSSMQLEQHRQDLREWEGLIQLGRAANFYPRARNNCIGRYGRCERWEECTTGDDKFGLLF